MKILGIDPGYGRLGYAVIETRGRELVAKVYGVITTEVGTDMGNRLAEIAKDLRSLITTHKPEVLCIEELFFAKNVTTALKVASVRGAIMLLAAEAKMEIIEVKPSEVKMALTGYGKADKKQIQEMVKVLFGLSRIPKPDDAADALAIAWAGAGKSGRRRVESKK